MYRLIRGSKDRLYRVRPAREEPRRSPLVPAQLLRGPHGDSSHPAETRTLGLGFALLSRQAA